ncbi:MAG: DUF1934 domain-containing protein [Acutalibacteraceae bacterium]
MRTKVIITFSGETTQNGEKDKTSLQAKGFMEKCENGYIISYTEPDSQMGRSKSVLHIKNRHFVELKRVGLYETSFLIEENKSHNCTYKTPYGTMDMEIIAKKVDSPITENGGKIHLEYILLSGGEILGENLLQLDIKTV